MGQVLMEHHMKVSDRDDQFVYIGRIERQKGIHVLLKAWDFLGAKAPRLIICGTGREKDICERYLEKGQLSMVKLRGVVPNEEVKAILRASSALIMPTQWYEGFPMVIVEAYSVGTAVIGSDIGNTADLVRDGVTGIHFRHDDPHALERAVRRIQQHPLDPERIREVYTAEFTAERNYRVLLDIYDRIAARS